MAEKSTFSSETRLIPWVAWAIAAIAFAGAQVGFNVFIARQPDAPPLAARIILGLVAGSLLSIILLLVGYVNRDAKRRGMNSLLWTLLVIFIPNALGFIAYFIVREPKLEACPRCGEQVQTAFAFCPKCNYALLPCCPNCKHALKEGYSFCPYCGNSVGASV
jgi:hypothetical protein